MNMHDIILELKRKTGRILFSGIIVSALAFSFMLFSQPAYRADIDFLVSPKNATGSDYYSLSRSSEYLGKALAQIVVSEKFMEAGFDSGMVDRAEFPIDKKDRLKQWSDTVSVSRGSEGGMLHVRVLAKSGRSVERTAKAVTDILSNKAGEFLGSGSEVDIRILSGPIVDRNPSFGELVAGSIGGFILGTFSVIISLLYRMSARSNRNHNFSQQ
jgi:hypothetical protein